MSAVTSVAISRTNWLASLEAHFAYPNKDEALRNLYKEVILEYTKPLIDEIVPNVSVDSLGPAWRWLILRDADSEDKMIQIVHKGDRKLYHKVRAYEQAKTED